MEKYYKACESEKRGKSTVVSLIGASILCFVILLVVLLKMSGVGKTIVFDSSVTNAGGQAAPYITEDVGGTNLAELAESELAAQ